MRRSLGTTLAAVVLAGLAASLSGPRSGAAVPVASLARWTLVAPMAQARFGHVSALLPDGTVLVAGGTSAGDVLASSETYAPGAPTWTAAGDMITPRWCAATVRLEGGRVLVMGGINDAGMLDAVEIYDPATRQWSATGSLQEGRGCPNVVALAGGAVLVTGGRAGNGVNHASAEVYDPASGGWSAVGSMAVARDAASATVLADGRVLVAGGSNGDTLASAEIFDPASGEWHDVAPLNEARGGHTATMLPDGTVLVAGGYAGSRLLDSAEVYDPVTDAWRSVPALMTARTAHSATTLADGRVLVAGGLTALMPSHTPFITATAEIYDPALGRWQQTASMLRARSNHEAILLPDGRVLVSGGIGNGLAIFQTVEVYDFFAVPVARDGGPLPRPLPHSQANREGVPSQAGSPSSAAEAALITPSRFACEWGRGRGRGPQWT